MDVNDLVARLEKAKRTSRDSWLACCPAHKDRTPSLTVRGLDDGRILIHCFSGCGAADVMAAIGLETADLFPAPIADHLPAVRQPFSSTDVLRALRREAAIVAISSADLAEGKPVDRERVFLASERIADACEYIHANA
jgi:hypothetical protein